MQGRGKVMLALGPRVLPLAIAMSSKPITDSCSGTRNPQSHAARRQRNAMRSLEQMTAVAAEHGDWCVPQAMQARHLVRQVEGAGDRCHGHASLPGDGLNAHDVLARNVLL